MIFIHLLPEVISGYNGINRINISLSWFNLQKHLFFKMILFVPAIFCIICKNHY